MVMELLQPMASLPVLGGGDDEGLGLGDEQSARFPCGWARCQNSRFGTAKTPWALLFALAFIGISPYAVGACAADRTRIFPLFRGNFGQSPA